MSISTQLFDFIYSYTGLSPTAFFTILSLMIAVYFYVSTYCFVSPDSSARSPSAETTATSTAAEEAVAPPAIFEKPVQMGDMTLKELSQYNGSNGNKPILIAIRGVVYNVSRGWLFYGPKGQYSFFAGKEISRALALMSFDPNDFNDTLDGLVPEEIEVLNDWEEKFKERYVQVGRIITNHLGAETNEQVEQTQ